MNKFRRIRVGLESFIPCNLRGEGLSCRERNRVKGRGVKRIEARMEGGAGLLRKMARGVEEKATTCGGEGEGGVNRGLKGRVGRGVIFAQPIPATLSTVKTWALTTGDHNRAYLPALPPSLSFSLSLVAPLCLPLLLVLPSRHTISRRILSRNFESTRRDREKEESRGKESRVVGSSGFIPME